MAHTAGGSYTAGYDGYASVRLASNSEGLGALSEFSLKTHATALSSMSMLEKSL